MIAASRSPGLGAADGHARRASGRSGAPLSRMACSCICPNPSRYQGSSSRRARARSPAAGVRRHPASAERRRRTGRAWSRPSVAAEPARSTTACVPQTSFSGDPAEQVAGDLAVTQGDGARDAIAPHACSTQHAGVAVREQRLGRAMPGMAIRQQRCGAADVLAGEGGDHPGSVLGPSSVSQRSGSRGRSKQSGRSYTNAGDAQPFGLGQVGRAPGRQARHPRAQDLAELRGRHLDGAGHDRRQRRARHLGPLRQHQGQPLGHAGGPQAGELAQLAGDAVGRRLGTAGEAGGQVGHGQLRRLDQPAEGAVHVRVRRHRSALARSGAAAPSCASRTRSPREGTARRP